MASDVLELNIDVEEADSRIVPHAMHVITYFIQRIIVVSADTDVFILLLFYLNEFKTNNLEGLWVKAEVGDTTRFISIHILAKKMGYGLCRVLPAIHTLTGCDYTSKIGTKHSALMVDPEMHLMDFGMIRSNLETVFHKAEEHLTLVLEKGTPLKTMDQLRNYTYSTIMKITHASKNYHQQVTPFD